MRKYLFLCFVVISVVVSAQVQPIPYGHAHNDYLHERPLFEALENGFTSIEIDVYLYKRELVVSHLPFGLNKKKTIQELYLDPIRELIKQNGGTVYKGFKTPVIFMIDFKTGRGETYSKLKEIIEQYKDMLAVYQGDSIIRANPIQILITGNKPFASVLQEDSCQMTIDAHTTVLDNPVRKGVVTRYSDPWHKRIVWNGKGEMPDNKKKKLELLVTKVHAVGKQIRFYHIPDNPVVWKVLLDAKVDWINTDEIKKFAEFLKEYRKN